MPELIESPQRIEAAGTAPKSILEFIGRVRTGTDDVANLGATDPRKTYGCKADNDGYLAEARSAPVVGY